MAAKNGKKAEIKHSSATNSECSPDVSFKNEVILWIVLAFSIILFISNFGIAGKLGNVISSLFFGLFGLVAYIFPLLLFAGTAFVISNRNNMLALVKELSAVVFVIFICFFLELVGGNSRIQTPFDAWLWSVEHRYGGGLLGGLLSWLICPNLGKVSAYIIDFVVLIVCMILITQRSLWKPIESGGRKIYTSAKKEAIRQHKQYTEKKERRMDKKVVGVSLDTSLKDMAKPENSDNVNELHAEPVAVGDFPIYMGNEPQNEPVHTMPQLQQAPQLQKTSQLQQAPQQNRAETVLNSALAEPVAVSNQKIELKPSIPRINASQTAVQEADDILSRTSELFSELLPDLGVKEEESLLAAGAEGQAMSFAAGFPDRREGGIPNETEPAASLDDLSYTNATYSEGTYTNATYSNEEYPDEAAVSVISGEFAKADQGDPGEEAAMNMASEEHIRAGNPEDGFRETASEEDARADYPEEGLRKTASEEDTQTGYPEETAFKVFMEDTDALSPEAYRADSGLDEVYPEAYMEEQPEYSDELYLNGSMEKRQPENIQDTDVREPKKVRHEVQAVSAGSTPVHNAKQSQTEIAAGVTAVAADIRPQVKREYILPPFELLKKGNPSQTGDSREHLQETALKLQQILKNFGVNVTILNVSCGPSVTRYEIQPEMGVKVSKIVNLADDIKLNLAAADIRIEAPIPGKAAIGIEVPNKENVTVMFRDLIEVDEFKHHKSPCAFAVGKDIAGKVIVTDICKMPHLLIAGATGSGKSVCINTIIMSMIYKANPDDVKMIMIDPKVVELSVYNGIPHLLLPVVTDPKKAAGALHWAVSEMMERYQKFANTGVRDIKGYNAKITNIEHIADDNKPEKMPYIVIIVDELADLMMVAPGDVEDAICRLAQLARAAGIHLIIATQRPSVNVITGLIKANMPSRIAFSVTSGIDSRTILDMNGAEKLLGKGDMLFYPQGMMKPLRVQGAFVSDQEVSAVVEFLTERNGVGQYNQDIEQQVANASAGSETVSIDASTADDKDAYFADAARLLLEKEKASVSMLQRYFKIGFNRAARIMDQLEEAGVVGPEEGTKPRKILMSPDEFAQYAEEYL